MRLRYLLIILMLMFIFAGISAFVPNIQLRRVADYYMDAATGRIPGVATVNKFGRNTDIDTAAEEDVWDGGGTWNEPSTTQVYTVTSTSADDAAAGTGARTVQIYGLDSTGLEANETITMTGLTPVTLTASLQMVHRMVVRSAGSGGVNAGMVTANANTDGNVTAQINAGNNQTLMAVYKIPSNYIGGCLVSYYGGINRSNTTGSTDVVVKAKPNGEVWQIKQVNGAIATGGSHLNHRYGTPQCFDPLTIVKMSMLVSANNMDVSAGFDLVNY